MEIFQGTIIVEIISYFSTRCSISALSLTFHGLIFSIVIIFIVLL